MIQEGKRKVSFVVSEIITIERNLESSKIKNVLFSYSHVAHFFVNLTFMRTLLSIISANNLSKTSPMMQLIM